MQLTSADGTKRCAARGCSQVFDFGYRIPKKGVTSKRYCSPRCRRRESRYRAGKRKRRVFGECLRGHPWTAETTLVFTRANGRTYKSCRLCRQKNNRDYYAAHIEEQRAATRDRYHRRKLRS